MHFACLVRPCNTTHIRKLPYCEAKIWTNRRQDIQKIVCEGTAECANRSIICSIIFMQFCSSSFKMMFHMLYNYWLDKPLFCLVLLSLVIRTQITTKWEGKTRNIVWELDLNPNHCGPLKCYGTWVLWNIGWETGKVYNVWHSLDLAVQSTAMFC